MDSQILLAIMGFLGAIIGGSLVLVAGRQQRRHDDRNLEQDEIRRRKMEIIYQLLGSRYVLQKNYPASSSEAQAFNTAIGGFSVYFREPNVVEAYDRFLTSKTDDNLLKLLERAAGTAGLQLMPSNLHRVISIRPTIVAVSAPRPSLGEESEQA